MNKETIEEASLRLYPIDLEGAWDFNKQYRDEWIEGAKWQAERMYSEEDLRKAFRHSRQALIFEKDMPPVYESFEEWFEQFKKKQSGE